MPEITVSEAYNKRHEIIAQGGKFFIQKGEKRFLVSFRTDVQPQSTDEQVHYRLFVHDGGQVPISLAGTKKVIVEYPESS